jgi:hypothetical protein
MVAIPFAHWFADGNDALGLGAWNLARTTIGLVAWRLGLHGIAELAQLGLKCDLDGFGIRSYELVFERQDAMRPAGKRFRFAELGQFRYQPLSEVFGRVRRQSWWFGRARTSPPFG